MSKGGRKSDRLGRAESQAVGLDAGPVELSQDLEQNDVTGSPSAASSWGLCPAAASRVWLGQGRRALTFHRGPSEPRGCVPSAGRRLHKHDGLISLAVLVAAGEALSRNIPPSVAQVFRIPAHNRQQE